MRWGLTGTAGTPATLPVNHSSEPDWGNDAILVARLQRGEAGAIAYVVQQYAPALYRFAFYQLHEATAAEDLVAEVLVRMIAGIHTFVPGEGAFAAWLFRIARNL